MGAVAKVFGWKSGRSRFSMGEVFEKKRADFGDRSAAKENEKKNGRTQFFDPVLVLPPQEGAQDDYAEEEEIRTPTTLSLGKYGIGASCALCCIYSPRSRCRK
jgi:hypothetical protein